MTDGCLVTSGALLISNRWRIAAIATGIDAPRPAMSRETRKSRTSATSMLCSGSTVVVPLAILTPLSQDSNSYCKVPYLRWVLSLRAVLISWAVRSDIA